MNFFIADTHIGCINKFENRTLEHDLLLKENWNKHVTNADDILEILGAWEIIKTMNIFLLFYPH